MDFSSTIKAIKSDDKSVCVKSITVWFFSQSVIAWQIANFAIDLLIICFDVSGMCAAIRSSTSCFNLTVLYHKPFTLQMEFLYFPNSIKSLALSNKEW